MRIMIRFSFPVVAGNAAIRDGKVEKVFQQLMDELKPEAAYFHAVNGDRGGSFVVDMQDFIADRRHRGAVVLRSGCQDRADPGDEPSRFAKGLVRRPEHHSALRITKALRR